MKRIGITLAVVGMLAACSSDDKKGVVAAADAGPVAVKIDPALPAADTVASVYADPGALTKAPENRGKILKLAKEDDFPKEIVQAMLDALGYKGRPVTTGAAVYRVLYQTERGDANGSAGYSSAKLLIPLIPAAEVSKLPVTVVLSGTRGQAKGCEASSKDPYAVDSTLTNAYATLAQGLPVIFTDMAGYANYGAKGNPPSGYAMSADGGRSTLDAARAVLKIFPQFSKQVNLIGHSLGGHTALSALAISESYLGSDAQIAAVGVHAPLWLAQRSWGALLDANTAASQGVSVASSPLTAAITAWYHYSHAEILDGEGEGIKLFKPEYQTKVKAFVDGYCLGGEFSSFPAVEYAAEMFVPGFGASIGGVAAGFQSTCPDATCTKWMDRYKADRPAITGAAANVPILITYGDKDTTIPLPRMKCAVETLSKDKATVKFCMKKGLDHSSVVGATAEGIVDFLKSKTIGGAESAMCDSDASGLTEACSTIPPNE
jgi:pimeloyl-ACP methyl ester carboxylesterase